MILADYKCDSCGDGQEHMVSSPAPDTIECEFCGELARWVPSAVFGRVKVGEVVRGKSDERPPGMLDTRPLAEGMSRSEWDQQQAKLTRELNFKRGKRVLDGG